MYVQHNTVVATSKNETHKSPRHKIDLVLAKASQRPNPYEVASQ